MPYESDLFNGVVVCLPSQMIMQPPQPIMIDMSQRFNLQITNELKRHGHHQFINQTKSKGIFPKHSGMLLSNIGVPMLIGFHLTLNMTLLLVFHCSDSDNYICP